MSEFVPLCWLGPAQTSCAARISQWSGIPASQRTTGRRDHSSPGMSDLCIRRAQFRLKRAIILSSATDDHNTVFYTTGASGESGLYPSGSRHWSIRSLLCRGANQILKVVATNLTNITYGTTISPPKRKHQLPVFRVLNDDCSRRFWRLVCTLRGHWPLADSWEGAKHYIRLWNQPIYSCPES